MLDVFLIILLIIILIICVIMIALIKTLKKEKNSLVLQAQKQKEQINTLKQEIKKSIIALNENEMHIQKLYKQNDLLKMRNANLSIKNKDFKENNNAIK